MAPDLDRLDWRKSSYSGGEGGQCVEVARTSEMAAVRDSKNPSGGVLVFNPAAFQRFLDDLPGLPSA
ncbi:DUF397 domain-containing protein [Crossiella sp. SN42]|uniref:DUF397 domain-containing protein n=1 Tax=Crossiella sp. SN42 TaxID=2944808 RepID=UPI00207C8ABC|nr:DUF397 domain-containing protein [Crossiella sp. SN42]MCO1575048.1 DUF397 domain-containing protein [Crossiella sp. SN42]